MDGALVVLHDGKRRRTIPLEKLRDSDLLNGYPVRRFQRNHNQSHKPGTIWLQTNQDLVGFESQHERGFAVLADFHPMVRHIASQPLTLVFRLDGEDRSHTPDYVVLCPGQCPLFVDVKLPDDAILEKWVRLHGRVAHLLASGGYGHLVWTGIHRRHLQNLGMLASARISDADYNPVASALLVMIRQAGGMNVDDLAFKAASIGVDNSTARITVRRMLWLGHLEMNFSDRFDGRCRVFAP